MNRFFDDEAKKLVLAESLSSYLEPTIEGLFYPATRKIYLPEGQMTFSLNEKPSASSVYIRAGLCEALSAKIRRGFNYPRVWNQLHPDLSTWQIVGFESNQKIEEIILIFIIKDFAVERQVLELQLQSLRKSSHYAKARCRLLLLNYSDKSNDFIKKHFQLGNYKLLSIPEMESLRRLDGTLVAEMNSHFFITESYFLHLGLSRGGIFWGPRIDEKAQKPTEQIVRLSLHHGLEVRGT